MNNEWDGICYSSSNSFDDSDGWKTTSNNYRL